jgi:hypothetical protein
MKNKNYILREKQSYPEGEKSEKWKIPKRKYSVRWICSAL